MAYVGAGVKPADEPRLPTGRDGAPAAPSAPAHAPAGVIGWSLRRASGRADPIRDIRCET
jgi:hypothetical protein